jgi:hypothetical protein
MNSTKEMNNQREHLQKLLINGQIKDIVAERRDAISTSAVSHMENLTNYE